MISPKYISDGCFQTAMHQSIVLINTCSALLNKYWYTAKWSNSLSKEDYSQFRINHQLHGFLFVLANLSRSIWSKIRLWYLKQTKPISAWIQDVKKNINQCCINIVWTFNLRPVSRRTAMKDWQMAQMLLI